MTYQEQMRKSAVNSLLTSKKLSGKMRRRLFKMMEVPVATYRTEPEDESVRLAQRLSSAPIASLGKWSRRVSRRSVTVRRGLEEAMTAGLIKLVDVLQVKRDRFAMLSGALANEINIRNK